MARKVISSPNAPKAVGPYSQAVWAGDLLFLAGQTPLNPATGKLAEGGAGEQTEQVLKNLEAVLAEAGLSFDNVIKANVFLISMDDFSAMNAVYQTKFNAPCPARSTIAVAALPLGARVEIELVARKGE